MRFSLGFLVLTSLVVFSPAVLKKKPKHLVITPKNQKDFGVPLGTVLTLDKHTRLYQPPPISDHFTPDDRIYLMWNNKDTYQNYCKVGPSIESAHFFYNFWWHQWCKNSTGHDICCKGRKCSCNLVKANCACLSPDGFEYWERKKEIDWQNVRQIWDTIKQLSPIYQLYKAFKGDNQTQSDDQTTKAR